MSSINATDTGVLNKIQSHINSMQIAWILYQNISIYLHVVRQYGVAVEQVEYPVEIFR